MSSDVIPDTWGPAQPGQKTDQIVMATDPDGRRRVVLPISTQKKLDQLIVELARHGFGMVVACRADFNRPDGQRPCGDWAIIERDQTDPGYGCRCSRVHFQR